jgi:glycerate dehydrogenase
MKIVFLDTDTLGNVPNLNIFEQFGEFISYPLTLHAERIARMKDADIVITNKVIVDREIINACPKLKLICVAATGINNIDTEYAAQKGIAVKNVKDYSTESVAQITIGMILTLMNQVGYYDAYVKSGKYALSKMFTHYGPSFSELKGKQAGIIGLGNIGNRVANILSCFGMEIVYYSTSGLNNSGLYKRLDLDTLLGTSDIVSIHSPLNENTRNLLNLDKLKLMKPSAFLINAGRGGIVNEMDLAHALNKNIIAGAGIDVFEKEPIPDQNPLLQITQPEKVVLSPHVAWASVEARKLLVEKIADNIRQFLY